MKFMHMQTERKRERERGPNLNEKQHNPSTNICVLLCLMMTLIRTESIVCSERGGGVYITGANSAVDSLVIDTDDTKRLDSP